MKVIKDLFTEQQCCIFMSMLYIHAGKPFEQQGYVVNVNKNG